MTGCMQIRSRRGPIALLYALILLAPQTAGQGLPDRSPDVSASNPLKSLPYLQLQYQSRSWKRNFTANAATTCSNNRSDSLCAAANRGNTDAYAQILIAASPQSYSSIDTTYTGGVRLVSSPQNQGECDTCSAFAVASAAETAIASALGVNVSQCSISVQALHFCPPGNQPRRGCAGGWSLRDTITLLSQTYTHLPTSACLSYKIDPTGELGKSYLCQGHCTSTNRYASQGTFDSVHITTPWEAQRHIRRHGAVVSRFVVMTDLTTFFEDPANAEKVYAPSPKAQHKFHHAVVLVGYNNDEQYWLVKNSWGSTWAHEGYFKVAYGHCSILTASGEAYGLQWVPNTQFRPQPLPLLPGPSNTCNLYKARAGDYMSKIAWLADVHLGDLLIDNVDIMKDLDASIEGKQLRVCKAQKGGNGTFDIDTYAQLVTAASPQSYSSIDRKDTGGLQLVSAPGDEGSCMTSASAAFAVASAAETAMASVLRVDVSQCSISVLALSFCRRHPGTSTWGGEGYKLDETLDLLVKSDARLPTAACLSYSARSYVDCLELDRLCQGKCTTPNKYANQGSFQLRQIIYEWEAHQHIRQYGAVITRFDIMDDLRAFAMDPAKAKAVYKPAPGAQPMYSSTVVLVGYNNDEQYWIVKNSWGSDWANGGYLKVAYGVCSIVTGPRLVLFSQQLGTGSEMYGLIWLPNSRPKVQQLPLSALPRPGCYWYKARASDYVSHIAWMAGVPLGKFIQDNEDVDLNVSLKGVKLLVCNPAPGTYYLVDDPASSTTG